jgi:hypothetical protein
VVLDTVGGDTLRRSWGVLQPGGRLVTVAADSEGTTDERVKQALFIVEPNQQQLLDGSALLEAGKLRAFVDAEAPFPKQRRRMGGNPNANSGMARPWSGFLSEGGSERLIDGGISRSVTRNRRLTSDPIPGCNEGGGDGVHP